MLRRQSIFAVLVALTFVQCVPPAGNVPPVPPRGPGGAVVPPGSDPLQPVAIQVADTAAKSVIDAGEFQVEIEKDPWHLRVVEKASGRALFDEDRGGGDGPWGRLGHGYHIGIPIPLYHGYFVEIGADIVWFRTRKVRSIRWTAQRVDLEIDTNDPFGRKMLVGLEDFRSRRFTLRAKLDPGRFVNRIGMSFGTPIDEGFFGFGERYNGANQRGNRLACWTEEGSFSAGVLGSRTSLMKYPGGATATYHPVPFFISSFGHGLELETPFRSTFDLARARGDAYRFEAEWRDMGVVFHLGRTPAETLKMFTAKTGRSLVPPKWEFAPWNQFSGQIPGKTSLEMADEFVRRDIPSSCRQGYVHFFPNGGDVGAEAGLAAENAAFHALGLKTTCYFNPYVGLKHPTLYAEGKQKGYLVRKKGSNDPFDFQFMHYHAAQVDFTNPAATAWYKAVLKKAVDLGYDGWMYDFGEYTPIESIFHDGREGEAVHNVYPLMYQDACFDFMKGLDPNPNDDYAPDYAYYVRSGYTGTQARTWAHWTGDPSCDWTYASGIPAQIPAGLTVGLAGVPFSGSDIGGFEWYVQPPSSPELYKRWTMLGCFSGIMRDQTGGFGHGPRTQIFDDPEAVRVWRKFAKLRTALFPYLYTLAHEHRTTGLPVMRHHLLAFPDDPQALLQNYQYLFGDRFLVAPVVDPGVRSWDVYLPAGETWYDVSSVARYDDADGRHRIGWSPALPGGQEVKVQAPEDVCPLFVRAGTIVATIDPSVDTLNPATDPRVTTLASREHLQHLWVWPDAAGKATGSLWDASSFEWAGAALTARGTAKTVVAQIALGANGKPTAVVGDASGTLPEEPSWTALAGVAPGRSAWAWDPGQGVLWIRLEPADRRAEVK